MKKIIPILSLAALSTLSLASCGKKKADYTVGILQYMSHVALNKATAGFKEEIQKEFESAGKTVEFIEKNPETDETQMKSMATLLVRECDLVMGNATPAATALKAAAATEGKTNLPILFTSVTNASDVGVDNPSSPEGNITGTSDANPVEKQIQLIKDFDSSITKIGFLYTQSENNSKSQCDTARDYAKANGYLTFTKTTPDMNGISSSVNALIADGCEAIYIPTDNIIASNMTTVANITNDKGVIVCCGESGMVENGGTISLSISYSELGKITGKQACDVLLNGKAIKDLPVQTLTDEKSFEFAFNQEALNKMGKSFSDEFKTKYGIN